MPSTFPSDTRLPRAPVALFLVPPHGRRPIQGPGDVLPDWYGIHPDHVAHLIARYTRDGDTVLDLDAHPTVAAAARHLHRHPGTPPTHGQQLAEPEIDRPPAGDVERLAGLVMATLPRIEVDSRDPYALSRAFDTWRALLRPGGSVIVLLTDGPGNENIGHRSAIVAAARAASLLYHQHIPAVLVALPHIEPLAETGPASRPPLLDGRHVRVHRDLLAFICTSLEPADA